MPNAIRRGFVPWGHISGGMGQISPPNRRTVATAYGTALFSGDVVRLGDDGSLEAAAAGSADILGILAWVSYVSSGARIDDTYLPASTAYVPTGLGSANASYGYVWEDPGMIYSVSIAAAALANHDTAAEYFEFNGNNMDHVATAGSIMYKASRHELDGTIVAGAAAGFRIIGPDPEIGQEVTLANSRWLVQINEGLNPYTNTTGHAS